MKKRGFTLIELLAVIVVLAIIALIAAPIVMNTIKKSQKGAAERSAENYIDAVETAVATAKLDSDGIPDGIYTINDKGNLEGNGLQEPLTIEMNGNKPTGGTITIKNGQVTTDSKMTVGSYEIAYNPTTKKYEAKESTSSEGDKTTSLICELQEGTSQTVGAKYTCHLDFDRPFYVLETSGNNISLIMDRNFVGGFSTTTWCIDDGDDNATCENINSKSEGTPLKDVQDIFGTNVDVSLPTASQLAKASGLEFDDSEFSGLPTWLYDELDGEYGYWTASPIEEDGALFVNNYGDVSSTNVTTSDTIGVRPVITISRSQLD